MSQRVNSRSLKNSNFENADCRKKIEIFEKNLKFLKTLVKKI